MTVNSRPKAQAMLYERSIRGLKTQNHHSALATMATLIRVQNGPRLPPVAEYDAWLEANSDPRGRGSRHISGAKLRRMAEMRRNGFSRKAAGEGVGLCSVIAIKWLRLLPASMGGETPTAIRTPSNTRSGREG